MCAYKDSDNKATIRRIWDARILELWVSKVGHRLAYLGLPGEDINDLIDWQSILESRRTGVQGLGHTKKEREQSAEIIGRINTNVLVRGVSSGFQLLRGDIEDIIINAVDVDGNPPQLYDGRAAHLARFQYDLINLDFCSGLGYKASTGAKRVMAIKKLFERQETHAFALLLTINVRDTLGDDIEYNLQHMRNLTTRPSWGEIIDWYLACGDGEREYKLKAVVPQFVRATAEVRGFACTCYPPIMYIGHEQAHMVHFVFEFEPAHVGGRIVDLRAFSKQADHDLIDLPLVRCENGILRIASQQHPHFDYASCARHLNFLPDHVRATVLEGVPQPSETGAEDE